MNIYKSQQMAAQDIDNIFERCKETHTAVQISHLLISITNKHPVSERFVLKRLHTLCDRDIVKMRGDWIEFQ